MIKGIIFDMDGVLVNTEPIHCISYIETFKQFGYLIEENEFYSHWTKNGGRLEDFLNKKGFTIDVETIRNYKREMYQEEIKRNLPVYGGARESVINLSKLYPLALATSSYSKETDIILEQIDLKKYFKKIITCDDVSNIKPHPECFLLAGKEIGIDPKNALVIEDAEKGIIAAHNAGMKSIAIPNEFTKNNDFSKAHLILKNVMELTPELIKNIQ